MSVAKALLKAGLVKSNDPSMRDADGNTPLANAVAGARADYVEAGGNDVYGEPLNEAQLEIVQMLLAQGANPNAFISAWNQTALGHAASRGDVRTVKLLLKYGANVHARMGEGTTALAEAAGSKRNQSTPPLAFGSLSPLTGGRRKSGVTSSGGGHAAEAFAAVGEAEAALARHGQHALAAVGDLVAPLAHFGGLAPAEVTGDHGGDAVQPDVVAVQRHHAERGVEERHDAHHRQRAEQDRRAAREADAARAARPGADAPGADDDVHQAVQQVDREQSQQEAVEQVEAGRRRVDRRRHQHRRHQAHQAECEVGDAEQQGERRSSHLTPPRDDSRVLGRNRAPRAPCRRAPPRRPGSAAWRTPPARRASSRPICSGSTRRRRGSGRARSRSRRRRAFPRRTAAAWARPSTAFHLQLVLHRRDAAHLLCDRLRAPLWGLRGGAAP